jgi:hypothetical protein
MIKCRICKTEPRMNKYRTVCKKCLQRPKMNKQTIRAIFGGKL